MELGGWRWMKAAPTVLPVFEPSGEKRTSGPMSDGERGKTRSGLKSALAGREGMLSGRESPTRLRIGMCARTMVSGAKLYCQCGAGAAPGAGDLAGRGG